MDPATRQIVSEAVARLGNGSAQREVARLAATLGCSEAHVYRLLREAGWTSGRKTRADKGQSSIPVEALRGVAAVVAKGRNKRGEVNIPVKEAHAIATEAGLLDCSYGHLVRRMRAEGLGVAAMRAPAPSIARISTHPNHVWFVDISVAIQWYFRDESGKYLDQYSDAGARFYEGKRQNMAALKKVLHRYQVVDHYTGAYFVQYFYSAGENSQDVVDFLYAAMAPKGANFPFRGVPSRICADQGPAFKNGLVTGLLGKQHGLGVEIELHTAGNAKASGAVESRHNHWQRSFEGRLALSPAKDLEELNQRAAAFCAIANAERPHSRHGQPPMALWVQTIGGHLVECPDRKVFYRLATTSAKEGTLDNRLYLRAMGREWYISGGNIHPGMKVQWRLAPFLEAGIRVYSGELELAATEIRRDPISGFAENGPRHVWDSEDAKGSSIPAPPAQAVAAAVKAGEAMDPAMMAAALDLSAAEKIAWLPTEGAAWTPPEAPPAEERLAEIELLEEVARRLERGLTRAEGREWRAMLGGGKTQSEFDQLWLEWTTEEQVAVEGGWKR